MRTIEQVLRDKLEYDFKSRFNKMNVIITNDINLYLQKGNKLVGNEMFVILQTGNGLRSASDDGGYITQSLAIYIYVPINHLQNCLSELTLYAAEESAANNIQTLEDYNFYVNYNTPATDGIIFDVSIYHYATIVLMGNFLYSTSEISVGTGIEYYIDNAKISNIISDISDCVPSTDSIQIEGTSQTKNPIIGIGNVFNLIILYDKNNNLHQELKELSYYVNARSSILKEIKIVDNELNKEITFNGILSVKRESSLNGFTMLNLTITRDGD
jgi:hypothetical protein